ncbi:amidohydrolase family protein [Prevotella falsenii]|uniref:hypothetical protein n=1 Tax=Prevotella falsenii TaxID=515414 RepID=UPI00046987E4|nr:hypothetical protein [Prevotella falsenii]
MKYHSYLSYLLTDRLSLSSYQEGGEVSVGDVKRRLMLIEREHNTTIPDHYLRLDANYSFQKIEEKSQIFTIGLTELADAFLEYRYNRVYVKAEKFNEWQYLIAYIPPMLLVCAYIFRNGHFSSQELTTDSFYNQSVAPNLRYTSFVSPYIRQMEDLKRKHNGFCDLHIHLNGTLETDTVWLDILKYPNCVISEMYDAEKDELVKEQYEQFDNWSRPDRFKELIEKANELRVELFDELSKKIPIFMDFTRRSESIFYIAVLYYLCLYPTNKDVADKFHHYLLILGLTNSILVQQPECFGFEQFQKYTSNKLRDFSEREYEQRFFQLAGNGLDNLRIIEGRFSPKDTKDKNNNLIDKIRRGWKKLNTAQMNLELPNSELRLIAHFIKKKDKQKGNIRFQKLRADIKRRSEILISMHKSVSKNGKFIVGIDAAASEFDTPPEVFAPVFKRLREKGFRHFTYHAGEDFYHLLGGLRAIYEAIEFLGLQRGDRIGHATAAGVSSKIWHKNVGDKIIVPKGAYMDDLLFAYYLASTEEGADLRPLMPQISMRVMELAGEIYQGDENIEAYISAWKNRKLDIVELDKQNKLIEYHLLELYHKKDYVEKYNEKIEVEIYEILDEAALHKVQLAILKLMHKKEIVIETLPTSNVLIGNHRQFCTFHLHNWFKWEGEGKAIPPIVLGTDDAGIFATNIYNEYCHVFTLLVYEYGVSVNGALDFIKKLNYNTEIYAFS